MKKIMIGLAALIAMSASVVSAQDRGHHGGGGRGGFQHGGGFGYGREGGPGGPARGYDPGGRPEFARPYYGRPDYAAGGGYPGGYDGPRGYAGRPGSGGAPRGFSRGQFLPPAYFGGAVADPRQYHLRRPPNGYGWVTVGPNAYLTQRSTGLILDTAPLY